jgi:hypothetical protein
MGTVFMFCAPELIFGGTEGVWSRFHDLRSQTRFCRYRGRRVPFSCFALPDSCSAVPRASCPVFMLCAQGLVFGGAASVVSRFNILPSESFSTVPSASGPFFMFCTPGLVFDCTEGIGSRFHVLRSRNRFRRCRGHQVSFSYFVLPESFSAVPSVMGPVFMFCAPGFIFVGTDGVASRFHVLLARTHFRRYLGRRVPFSCFALPESFSAVPGASGPAFMFYALEIVFGGTGGVGSRFHILSSRTRFRRCRVRRIPFSCSALPDSFSMVQGA